MYTGIFILITSFISIDRLLSAALELSLWACNPLSRFLVQELQIAGILLFLEIIRKRNPIP
jgi:hypothetical protein